MITLRILTPEEAADFEDLPVDDSWRNEWATECDGKPHEWEPVNTSRGRAYQCQRCWDRTD